MFFTMLGMLFWSLLSSGAIGFFTGCCCGCPCTPGTSFQIDISGVVNGTTGPLPCTMCANFNGTYFLTTSATTCGGTNDTCTWKYANLTMADACNDYAPFGGPCDGVCVSLQQETTLPSHVTNVTIVGSGPSPLGGGVCSIGGNPATPIAVFSHDFGAMSSSCSDYNPLTLTNTSPSGLTAKDRCDWTAATVTATAI